MGKKSFTIEGTLPICFTVLAYDKDEALESVEDYLYEIENMFSRKNGMYYTPQDFKIEVVEEDYE